MKFDHLVKHNGEYYPAGTEVPVGEDKKMQESAGEQDGAKRGKKPKEE